MAKIVKIPITPKTMINTWSNVLHQFQLNLWNFEVQAAREAVGVFKESFDLRRFNKNGSTPWKQRKRSYPHPILEETSTLKNSIEWKRADKDTVSIYTNPSKFNTAARHKGFCYAAIHNEGIGRMPKRQFMGNTPILVKKIKNLYPTIFTRMP